MFMISSPYVSETCRSCDQGTHRYPQPGKLSTLLWNVGAGLVHSGVVIGDAEYAFGAHQKSGTTGVYFTRPKLEPPGGTFRCEILQGFSLRSQDEIDSIILEVRLFVAHRRCFRQGLANVHPRLVMSFWASRAFRTFDQYFDAAGLTDRDTYRTFLEFAQEQLQPLHVISLSTADRKGRAVMAESSCHNWTVYAVSRASAVDHRARRRNSSRRAPRRHGRRADDNAQPLEGRSES